MGFKMTRSTESNFSLELKNKINKIPFAYFTKISDRYQIGLLDLIGSYHGNYIALESKVENVVKAGKKVPTGHPFTKAQVNEMRSTQPCTTG